MLPIKDEINNFFKLVCLFKIIATPISNKKSKIKLSTNNKSIYMFITITNYSIKKI